VRQAVVDQLPRVGLVRNQFDWHNGRFFGHKRAIRWQIKQLYKRSRSNLDLRGGLSQSISSQGNFCLHPISVSLIALTGSGIYCTRSEMRHCFGCGFLVQGLVGAGKMARGGESCKEAAHEATADTTHRNRTTNRRHGT
jgi:hypothetical protein